MTIKIEIPQYDIFVSIDNFILIPSKISGIYVFLNECGELMYIGKAKRLRERIQQHLSGTDKNSDSIFHNFKYVACIYVDSEVNREIYETYMINKLKPLLNVNKVYTYTSEKYNPKYNRLIERQNKEWQERFDKAMDGFSLL